MAALLSEQGAEELAQTISDAAQTFGQSLVNDVNIPVASQLQSYARGVCQLWARGPSFSNGEQVLGYATICTPYLQSINQDPISGSFVPGVCFGELSYSRFVTTNYQGPVSRQDVRSDYVIQTYVWTGTPPITGFPNCPSGQDYRLTVAQWDDPSEPDGIAWVSLRGSGCGQAAVEAARPQWPGEENLIIDEVFFCPNPGEDTYNDPTPRPGLPPVDPLPDYPTVYGDREVSISLEPDGTIIFDLGDGEVKIAPPDSTGTIPGAVFNPPSSPPETGSPSGGIGDNPESFPEPEPGTAWGLIACEIVSAPNWADQIFTAGGQADYFRPFGSISGVFQDESGQSFDTEYVPIHSTTTLVKIPGDGLSFTGYRVRTAPEFQTRVRAIATQLPEQTKKTSEEL